MMHKFINYKKELFSILVIITMLVAILLGIFFGFKKTIIYEGQLFWQNDNPILVLNKKSFHDIGYKKENLLLNYENQYYEGSIIFSENINEKFIYFLKADLPKINETKIFVEGKSISIIQFLIKGD